MQDYTVDCSILIMAISLSWIAIKLFLDRLVSRQDYRIVDILFEVVAILMWGVFFLKIHARTVLVLLLIVMCGSVKAQGVSYTIPKDYTGEIYYRSQTKHTIKSQPEEFRVIYDSTSGGYLYFKPLPPKPNITYVMVSASRYKKIIFYENDTMYYDNRPDIYYRIRQTSIYRKVRRFKR
jgi:hypothetical protein